MNSKMVVMLTDLKQHQHCGLQDWQKLIKNIDTAIPSMEQIHASERLGREVAPLLDATQQKQICSMGMQHHARLTAQKQLSTTLQQALTSAGAQPSGVKGIHVSAIASQKMKTLSSILKCQGINSLTAAFVRQSIGVHLLKRQ